ncbi:GNAT family N-acetyltransferase [Oceanicaulis alexandrii]|uniref:GNAT family N-acetyltransferase n=1 Tax=Oceanicaulis alexandrii TaxID=153233 RepID=UPI0003B32C56|nr:GNAT family N-acetyltransferase [Oceanicaulis alexandrii]
MSVTLTVYDTLAQAQDMVRDQVYALICEADDAFWPPLRARTPEQGLSVGEGAVLDAAPTAYWASIQPHALITASDAAGRVLGMMSVARDKRLDALDMTASAYLSTLIVAKSAQGRGLARTLYEGLFDLARSWSEAPCVATRTWSTNGAHLPLIAKLGFEERLRLKDDRGAGIDTVYFLKPL